MSLPTEPGKDARRAATRRTAWLLAVVAAGFYGWFIVKAVTAPGGAG